MTDLTFAKPCTLTLEDGTQRVFVPGLHRDISDDIANHWWVKAHLVQEADAPAAPESAPLINEERVKVKAAIDAADGRSRGAEAARDAAVSRADSLQQQLDAERQAHAETRALLDAATAPQGGDSSETDEKVGDLTVKHRGRGTFAVMRGDTILADGLTKEAAEARADEMKAQG